MRTWKLKIIVFCIRPYSALFSGRKRERTGQIIQKDPIALACFPKKIPMTLKIPEIPDNPICFSSVFCFYDIAPLLLISNVLFFILEIRIK
jgi:hypothetical protein